MPLGMALFPASSPSALIKFIHHAGLYNKGFTDFRNPKCRQCLRGKSIGEKRKRGKCGDSDARPPPDGDRYEKKRSSGGTDGRMKTGGKDRSLFQKKKIRFLFEKQAAW